MGIEVVKLPNIEGQFKERFDAAKKAFSIAFSDEVTRLIIRSRAGMDKNGVPWKGLTPDYAKWKESKGRQPNADLTFTGSLLASVQGSKKITDNGTSMTGEISVTGSSVYHALGSKSGKTRSVSNVDKARGLIAGGRDFMGFPPDGLARIRAAIKAAIKG